MSVLSVMNWLPCNKPLYKYLESKEAALVLAELINQRDYWAIKGKLEGDGSFYVLNEYLEDELLIGKKMRLKCYQILEEEGLIEIRQRFFPIDNKGTQSVNFFYINDLAIGELIKACNIRVGAQRALPWVPKEPANKNTTAYVKTETPEDPNPTWRDVVNTWRGMYPDYALNILKKTHILAELFLLLADQGYTKTDCSSFLGELKKYLQSDTDTKLWRTNISNTVDTAFYQVYPVQQSPEAAYAKRKASGVKTEVQNVPHEAKTFEEKEVVIIDFTLEDLV